MASHMRPPRSKARPFGILAVALGVGLLVLVVFDQNGDDDDAALVRDEAEQTTDPTVLGEVIERSTTLPAAAPAIPATFAVDSDSGSGSGAGEGGPTGPTSTQPPDTTNPTLIPPTSITSPNPPRTTTTTAPTTTTTDGPTTTEPTTTTTEPPVDG
jgi:hypothetical protein